MEDNKEIATTGPAAPPTLRGIFERDSVAKKFQAMLGKKAQGFITSVLQIVNSNNNLSQADPMTVYYAAATAATMDLPINPNLGFAWIVPYKNKGKMQAQFQMGAKGYIQLGLRTGQYLRMNVVSVYENQFKGYNSLTEELDADFSIDGDGAVVGYCAYFKLINGFEKTIYWSKAKVEKHAKRFSQSYGYESSPWKSDFDSMAQKTVLKHSLSKWGILSIEMQQAILVDQAIINNEDGTDLTYIDNPDKEEETAADKAAKATDATLEKLNRKTGAATATGDKIEKDLEKK